MRFVDNTAYVTEAESFGYSAVFHLCPRCAAQRGDGTEAAGTPGGSGSWARGLAAPRRTDSIDGLDDHPVVHVSWNDADGVHCDWAGRALPTEAQSGSVPHEPAPRACATLG